MLTQSILNVFGLCFNYSYYLCILPIYWDKSSKRLVISNSKGRFLGCLLHISCIIILTLTILEKVFWHLSGKVNDPMIFVLCIIGVLALTCPILIGLKLLFEGSEVVDVLNHYMEYFDKFAQWYSLGNVGFGNKLPFMSSAESSSSFTLELVLKCTLFLASTQPISTLCLTYYIFLQPSRRIFLTSVAPGFDEQSVNVVLVVGLIQMVIVHSAISICVCAFAISFIYMYEMIYVLRQINSCTHFTLLDTIPSLRSPTKSLFNYRCLQLLQAEINDLGQWIVPIFMLLLMALSITANISIMLYSHVLVLGLTPIITVILTTFYAQVATYNKMGAVLVISKCWISSWKCNGWGQIKSSCVVLKSKYDVRLMKKYVASCAPLVLKIGHFGRIKQITSLVVLGRIIFYTSRFMLAFRDILA